MREPWRASTLVAVVHDHGSHGDAAGHAHVVGGGTGAVRVIGVALALNALLAVGQVVAGMAFGSIALLADSVQQVVVVVGLVIALVGARLAVRGVTSTHTYGWGRADVLGALLSAVLLVGSSARRCGSASRPFDGWRIRLRSMGGPCWWSPSSGWS